MFLVRNKNSLDRLDMMNIEAYREYCLSLGADVEEKLPFVNISLKCQPERIDELKAQYDCIGNPYNEAPKYWIGINPNTALDDLLRDLTRNSYEIVKVKYS